MDSSSDVPLGTLTSGEECVYSADCISTCCAVNFEIDTTAVLGFAMYDTTQLYSDAEIQSMVAMQSRILDDEAVSYVNYGVQYYFDSDSSANIPEYWLTYTPEFSQSAGANKIEFNYPVCQSNTTMCGNKAYGSDWNRDAAMGQAISMLLIGLSATVASI